MKLITAKLKLLGTHKMTAKKTKQHQQQYQFNDLSDNTEENESYSSISSSEFIWSGDGGFCWQCFSSSQS